jgi:hypothetical protein
MLNPALNILPDYKGISNLTSGGYSGFSYLTQCANVSSKSNKRSFVIPLFFFFKSKSTFLESISF